MKITPEYIINRLRSDEPDFDDCEAAANLIINLMAELKGPEGYETWREAAIAERLRRVALEKSKDEETMHLYHYYIRYGKRGERHVWGVIEAEFIVKTYENMTYLLAPTVEKYQLKEDEYIVESFSKVY